MDAYRNGCINVSNYFMQKGVGPRAPWGAYPTIVDRVAVCLMSMGNPFSGEGGVSVAALMNLR